MWAFTPLVELMMAIDPPRPASTMSGTVTWRVFQVPVKMTSMASCQAWGASSPNVPAGWIPALATTMVTGPRPSRTLPVGPPRPARSRTSALRATMRRPIASTAATVSARSASVAMAYWTEGIWPQMSTAMMSAPSLASFTAWARPWPRAAPVMKATWPSRLPIGPPLPRSSGRR